MLENFINYIFYINIDILQNSTTTSLRGCVCIKNGRNQIFKKKRKKNQIEVHGAILERWFSLLFGIMWLFHIKGGFNLKRTSSRILPFKNIFTHFHMFGRWKSETFLIESAKLEQPILILKDVFETCNLSYYGWTCPFSIAMFFVSYELFCSFFSAVLEYNHQT